MRDIRWRQRLHNFNKAMNHLETALQIEQPDLLQTAGIIQFFEISFELAWKMLKDYLEEQGFQDVKSPRLLEDRNRTVHDEETATEIETLISGKYFPMMKELQNTFNQKANEP
jgi:hypothetical protein